MHTIGHPSRPVARRTAFTLLEILLVMAILVAVAAMAWPALQGSLEAQRLRSAADGVRAAWTDARLQAMTTGVIHLFSYEPEGRTFMVAPWEGFDAQVEASDTDVFALEGAATGAERWLPEGTSFAAVQQAEDARAATLGADVDTSGAAVAGLAPPVVFYPDGSTSTVELLLMDETEHSVIVSMRGLTGTVTIREPAEDEEGLP